MYTNTNSGEQHNYHSKVKNCGPANDEHLKHLIHYKKCFF